MVRLGHVYPLEIETLMPTAENEDYALHEFKRIKLMPARKSFEPAIASGAHCHQPPIACVRVEATAWR